MTVGMMSIVRSTIFYPSNFGLGDYEVPKNLEYWSRSWCIGGWGLGWMFSSLLSCSGSGVCR